MLDYDAIRRRASRCNVGIIRRDIVKAKTYPKDVSSKCVVQEWLKK